MRIKLVGPAQPITNVHEIAIAAKNRLGNYKTIPAQAMPEQYQYSFKQAKDLWHKIPPSG
jgi:hypothetical protein